MGSELRYVPSPTGYKFHSGLDKTVRGLMGPFGSGKSVTCVEDLCFIGMRQAPNRNKERNVRFGVIRATYPNLRTTTKKTMEEWLPPECGGIKETAPMEGKYIIPLIDGTKLVMELLLIACEEEAQVKKLRSTNFTAIWINEATEVTAEVLDACIERIGRYPSGQLGKCSWSGIIMDYNKPPIGHWLHDLFLQENKPDDYELYIQPPAMFKRETEDGRVLYEANHQADNLANLPNGVEYYYRMVESRRARDKLYEIDQLLCLEDTDDRSGKPVWPSFDRKVHVAKVEIESQEYTDTIIAIDTSGVHPAALFIQFLGGMWCVTDELYGDGSGFADFCDEGLLPLLMTRYRNCDVSAVCDPANARDSMTATTPTAALAQRGIKADVASTNTPKIRIETVSQMLNRRQGGILISPTCKLLIAACAGGYKYPKKKISGSIDLTYSATPVKDEHSHPADALQYFALKVLRVESTEERADEVRKAMAGRTQRRRRIL